MNALADVLNRAGRPEWIAQPADETFVTVKLRSGGAVRRTIGSGKTPVPFTGYRVRANQFIYSRIDARNGAFAFVPEYLDGAVVSKDFPVFDVRDDTVDRSYLSHFFRAGVLEREIRARSFGATNRQRLDEDTFLQFPITLPHLDEQRRIAAILDRADLLRSKRLNVLGHLERLTTTIFRQMFGDTGRPRKCLGSIAEWRSGGTPSRTQSELFGGQIPWFTSGELGRTYVSETRETLTELGLKMSSAKLIAPQNVLIGMYDTAALKTGITQVEASCNQAVAFSHRIQHPYSAEYVQAAIEIERDRILALRRGVRQKNLNLSMIRAIDIPAADEAEVVAFGRRMRSIHKTIASVGEEQRLEEQLFASLQSRAFRGEL
ncbi:restriction endonuclease subunit S [Microbacterium algeriense]|uniref:restriction endonuclease subunit S n=1 Tax=Microbacterium algeriense TaxID=2615184 RepID=UPI0022E2DA76|nr:restriction endonuclease subunit S [Microbacterium algeriense]